MLWSRAKFYHGQLKQCQILKIFWNPCGFLWVTHAFSSLRRDFTDLDQIWPWRAINFYGQDRIGVCLHCFSKSVFKERARFFYFWSDNFLLPVTFFGANLIFLTQITIFRNLVKVLCQGQNSIGPASFSVAPKETQSCIWQMWNTFFTWVHHRLFSGKFSIVNCLSLKSCSYLKKTDFPEISLKFRVANENSH